jgi:hypothetical protein
MNKYCKTCGRPAKDIILDVFIHDRGAWVKNNNPMICINGEGHDFSDDNENIDKNKLQKESK